MNNLTYEGQFDTTDIKWVELSASERAKLSLVRGDLLFNRTNSRELVGKTGVWNGPDNFTFAGYLIRVRLREDRVLPGWISAFMNSPTGKTALFHMAKPSINMANISATDLLRLEVPIAPLEHQRRAIAQLEKADAIRRKRKEAIALTEELLRSAFLEMFGDPVTNPKGWPVKTIRELLAMPLRNGLSPASGGSHAAKVLTLSAITRGNFDATAVKQGMFAVEPWDDVRLDDRDFLICRGNGNLNLVGAGAFPTVTDATTVFPDTMIAARVDRDFVASSFLATVWKSRLVRRQIEASARTTNGTYKVNQTAVESIAIPVPSRRLQEEFEVTGHRLASILRNQTIATDHGRDLFEALVHRAFRGDLARSDTSRSISHSERLHARRRP